MKLKALSTAAIIAGCSILTPMVVWSQPSPTGSREPGFWQPEVNVDPNQPVTVIISNQTGLPLTYNSYSASVSGGRIIDDRDLPANGTAQVNVGISSELADIASINIYNADGAVLLYDFNARGNQVTVRVRLRLEDSTEEPDLAVYIDENGRVYAF
ncbi:MAG: hypothetical protein D6728_01985 [Cyanobacteria bacterium J055]|nr:MAG: hypothetical protein D6728_01985 [Cyanobacteria bacterium J055]